MDVFCDRVSPGGLHILDDYGCWEGGKIKFDGYFHEKSFVLVPR